MLRRLGLMALAVPLTCAAGGVFAQKDYPHRPIRLLVGVTPGGATDTLARILGQKLGERWRQQVVVDNRPGASHIIATELTSKAAPDGYTLQIVPAEFAINPAVHRKLPYDAIRDFTPVVMVAIVPNMLVVHPSIPVKNVADFISYARARPGELSYGSSGVGAPSHMCAELLGMLAGIKMTHVPYKGQAQAVIDLLAGRLKMGFPSIPASIQHVKAGRLIPLGVASGNRSPSLPDVPTIQEGGVQGYAVNSWYGVIAPPKMARPLLAKINGEINRIIAVPDTRQVLTQQGADLLGGTPEEFARTIAADIAKWQRVVAAAGIKPEQ